MNAGTQNHGWMAEVHTDYHMHLRTSASAWRHWGLPRRGLLGTVPGIPPGIALALAPGAEAQAALHHPSCAAAVACAGGRL